MFQLSLSTSLTSPTAPGAGTSPAPSGAFSLALADALGPIAAPDAGGGAILLPAAARQAAAGDGKTLPAGAVTSAGADSTDRPLAWLDAAVSAPVAGTQNCSDPAAATDSNGAPPWSTPVFGALPTSCGAPNSNAGLSAVVIAEAEDSENEQFPAAADVAAETVVTDQTELSHSDDQTAPESQDSAAAADAAGTSPSIAAPISIVTTAAAAPSSNTPAAGSRERARQAASIQREELAADGSDASAATMAAIVAMAVTVPAPARPDAVQPAQSASVPIAIGKAVSTAAAGAASDRAPLLGAPLAAPPVPAGSARNAAPGLQSQGDPTTPFSVAAAQPAQAIAAVIQGKADVAISPATAAIDGSAYDAGASASTQSIATPAVSASPAPADPQGAVVAVAAPPPVATSGPAMAQPAGMVFGIALGAAVAADQRSTPSDRSSPRDEALQALTAVAGSAQVLAVPAAAGGPAHDALDMRRGDWPQAMIDRIEALRDAADAQDTSIRLVPDALGKVDVSIRHDGDAVNVHFTAEVPATRQMIADAQPRLAQAAEARGIRLGQTAVDAGTTSANQQQHQQRGAMPQPRFSIRPAPAPATAASDDVAAPDSTRLA